MGLQIRRRVGLRRSNLHVMNRGARRLNIFVSDEDRRLFVGLMGHLALKYEVRLQAWCLMPNHYHLESESEGTPLTLMMRDLDGGYARYFNERHGTTGCLFQGPFRSMMIPELDGVAYVSRYIHLNPRDLGAGVSSYPWSSLKHYLERTPPPPWMDLEPVARGLGVSSEMLPQAYASYLAEAPPKRARKATDSEEEERDEDFYLEWLRFLEGKAVEWVMHQGWAGSVSPKLLACWQALDRDGIPARLIAEYFGYQSPGSVRTAVDKFRERIQIDPLLANLRPAG